MIHDSDWTFYGFVNVFDGHVRPPWYELASAAMGARQHILKGLKVYDLEASTATPGCTRTYA